ncbi:MAG: acyltransferase [Lachnospiraceae bacterium]|nr:acyltransferase [Lachnospiraceae bacterium]
MKKERNASIDLLRIVLMLGVLIIHTCAHGLGLSKLSEGTYTGNQYSYLLIVMQSFSIVAVDVFFIISGYFTGELKARKIVEFYIMGGLYCSLAYVVSTIAGYNTFSILSFGRRALQGFTNYWFLTAYVIIFLFSPFIVKLLDSLDDKQLKRLILTYVLVNTLFGYLLSSVTYGSGFSVDAMLFCYILGYGIRRFNWTFSCKDKSVNFLCYLVPVVFISAFGCAAYSIGKQEFSYQIFDDYRNPIIIFASVACFCLFARSIKIKNASIAKIVTEAGGGYAGSLLNDRHIRYKSSRIRSNCKSNGKQCSSLGAWTDNCGVLHCCLDFVYMF